MTDPGALDRMRAACSHVAAGIPLADLEEARQRARIALVELQAAGSSVGTDYRQALYSLKALLLDIDSVEADVRTAADHARAYRGRLG